MGKELIERNMSSYVSTLVEARWSPVIVENFFMKLLGKERPFLKLRNVPVNGKMFNLNVRDSEIISVSGEESRNLMKVLSGSRRLRNGNMLVREGNYFDEVDRKSWAYQVGFAGEEHSLYPELSIAQNWKYFGRQYGMNTHEISTRMHRLSGELGLAPYMHIPVHELPESVVVFADLGCAMLHEPKLLCVHRPNLSANLMGHYSRVLHNERLRGNSIIAYNLPEISDRHIVI